MLIFTYRWDARRIDNGHRVECRVWNRALGERTHADGPAPTLNALSPPITVHYAPEVTVGPSEKHAVFLNETASLQCNADGNPARYNYT